MEKLLSGNYEEWKGEESSKPRIETFEKNLFIWLYIHECIKKKINLFKKWVG